MEAIKERYVGCSRREKNGMFAEFTEVTGYHRKAYIKLLNRECQGNGGDGSGKVRSRVTT